MHPVAVGADLEKAFLQVGLQEEDRDVTRFFWLKDPKLPTLDENIQVYRFKRVCFGIKPSPFLLEITVKYHLNQWNSPAADLISENVYVDNVLVGFNSPEEAHTFYMEAKKIFGAASMNFREWMSNSEEFMEKIHASDQVEKPVSKVLGLVWDRREDTLQIKCPQESTGKTTKRTVMKTLAGIFDPLGVVAPAVLPGKVLIQDLWQKKLDWDQISCR